jgi:tetratricopeptide (TPR) repeat protein
MLSFCCGFTLSRYHYNLGNALRAKGDLDGAIAAYKAALRLDPKKQSAVRNLSRAERLRQLLRRLPAVLAGKDKPTSPAEGCAFADLCAQPFQKRYAQGARLYAEAFAADSKLAEDLQADHRYNAACCAVLAGCGQDPHADKPDEQEKARLQGQALAWLRADLVLRRHQTGAAEAAPRQEAAAQLAHWLRDTELAGVRAPQALAKLPAKEQQPWQQIWADVKVTLTQAKKPAPSAGQATGKK